MRIGMVVVDLLDVKRVGSERRYGELIRRLRTEGCDVHLFARRWDRDAAQGLACHRIPVGGPEAVLPLVFALGALAVTRRWRSGMDLIHSHAKSLGEDLVSPGGSAHRALLGALDRRDPGWLRLARAWHPRHRSRIVVERWQFRAVRRIVTNSAFSARSLAGAYPAAAGKVQVVHNGIDTEYFSPRVRADVREATRRRLGLAPGQPAFLLVGAGVRRKGTLELLEALAGLAVPAARAILLGRRDAGESVAVDRALDRLRLRDRVTLQDFAPDPRPYYAAADVFVLPTKFDPFSNATAEALACGLPVITTSANGISELMTDGREGFVVADPYDVAGLRAAMAAVLEADRKQMGEAGRGLAETLTWKRHVDAMLQIYADLISESR
jgi:UDP-glucose:(heptosyl)LPS alpha-1,3-glucosyltransferase